MNVVELRNLDEARRFIYEGLWLQKAVPPQAAHLRTILEWALEIVSSGEPLPPIGFVADVGITAFGMERGERRAAQDSLPLSEHAKSVLRQYEDFVLGKIYGDWTFERACDALRDEKYQSARDRARGLAFLITRSRKTAKFRGVLFSPSILRGLLDASPTDTLARGQESLRKHGLMPLLAESYAALVDDAKRSAELLQEEDYSGLENGIALAEEGQRLAHDQVIAASTNLRRLLPQHKVKPLADRQELPTHILDEDTYPVGGFSSISTRGSIESLLHSQLAYMETKTRPDLFDIKYLRDELYFYSRDENQFLRRRRTFVFAFYPDLIHARFKDPSQDFQRIVLLLGLVRAGIQKLIEWLSGDALKFVLMFPNDEKTLALKHEYDLFALVFAKEIENGTVELHATKLVKESEVTLSTADIRELCQTRARRSLVHCLTVAAHDVKAEMDDTVVTRLKVDAAVPKLGHAGDEEAEEIGDWHNVLERLLQIWI